MTLLRNALDQPEVFSDFLGALLIGSTQLTLIHALP